MITNCIDAGQNTFYTTNMSVDEEILYRILGQRLKAIRTKLKLTQAQLAETSDVSRASIAIIENGKQSSPLHVIYKLCSALGTEVTSILPANNEVTSKPIHDPIEILPITADFIEQSKKKLEREKS
jgi:transcriptional regulator with XRE-family HTH domain